MERIDFLKIFKDIVFYFGIFGKKIEKKMGKRWAKDGKKMRKR
jgi:hypothetical protein